MKFLTLVLMALSLVGCSQASKSDESQNGEISLKADRSGLNEIRKDIPADIRKDNDELAGILQLLRNPNGVYERPEKIRERFNKVMREKRSQMDKQFRQEREDFRRLEKDQREEFTQNQKKERENFLNDKPKSDERRRFFDRQQVNRSRFYEDTREKRRSFESQISSRRKDFEDYVRERTNFFNQEHRNYQKEYDEYKKGEDLQRRMEKKASISSKNRPVSQPNLSDSVGLSEEAQSEFDQIPKSGTPLGAGEN